MTEQFMSMKTIAARLDTNVKTLTEERARGKFTLPMVKVGRMLRCTETAFNEWVKKARVT